MEFSFLLILLFVILAAVVVFIAYHISKNASITNGGKFGSPGRSYSSSSSSGSRGIFGNSRKRDWQQYATAWVATNWNHRCNIVLSILGGPGMLDDPSYFHDWGQNTSKKELYRKRKYVPYGMDYLKINGKNFIVYPKWIDMYVKHMRQNFDNADRLSDKYIYSYLSLLNSIPKDDLLNQIKDHKSFGVDLVSLILPENIIYPSMTWIYLDKVKKNELIKSIITLYDLWKKYHPQKLEETIITDQNDAIRSRVEKFVETQRLSN